MTTDVLIMQHPVSEMHCLPILENVRQQRLSKKHLKTHYFLVILNNVYI
jgi:hypothetical protein